MTPEQIAGQRQDVVQAAITWIGTPYHHMARVRGAGADCITFLAGAFEQGRAMPRIDIPHYPPDWHMHRDVERYMEGLLSYCTEQPPIEERTPEPGDIVLFRIGRTFSHGALVEAWPNLIHAYVREGVRRTSYETDLRLRQMGERDGEPRPIKIFTAKVWVT